jgi:hypothetical protein
VPRPEVSLAIGRTVRRVPGAEHSGWLVAELPGGELDLL